MFTVNYTYTIGIVPAGSKLMFNFLISKMSEFKPKVIFTGISRGCSDDIDYKDLVPVIPESKAVCLGGTFLENINVKIVTVYFDVNVYFVSGSTMIFYILTVAAFCMLCTN